VCRLVAKLQSLMSTVLDSFKTLWTNFFVMIYFMCILQSFIYLFIIYVVTYLLAD